MVVFWFLSFGCCLSTVKSTDIIRTLSEVLAQRQLLTQTTNQKFHAASWITIFYAEASNGHRNIWE